jgi:hypothetical protein
MEVRSLRSAEPLMLTLFGAVLIGAARMARRDVSDRG